MSKRFVSWLRLTFQFCRVFACSTLLISYSRGRFLVNLVREWAETDRSRLCVGLALKATLRDTTERKGRSHTLTKLINQ